MTKDASRATGWWTFAGIILAVAGVLNIIWGIGAIDDSTFFTENARYLVFDDLNTWGWIALAIGVVQLFAAVSLFGGGGFGRWVGIIAASLGAINALLSISAAPFWALCIFALSIIILYELAKPRAADTI